MDPRFKGKLGCAVATKELLKFEAGVCRVPRIPTQNIILLLLVLCYSALNYCRKVRFYLLCEFVKCFAFIYIYIFKYTLNCSVNS